MVVAKFATVNKYVHFLHILIFVCYNLIGDSMEELNIKIDELIALLDEDSRIKDIEVLKDKIINNKDILNKINRLKELDIYSNEYKSLKQELFLDEDFKSFKEKEAEIDYLILEINSKLNSLVGKGKCNHESN